MTQSSTKSIWAFSGILMLFVVLGGIGCNRKQSSSPAIVKDKTVAPKVDPEPSKKLSTPPQPKLQDTGTVKFEFDVAVDLNSVVTIDEKEYSPKELELPIALEPGEHTIVIKQSGRELASQTFNVEKGQRQVQQVFNPERKVAEWVLEIPGQLSIWIDTDEREAKSLDDLPSTNLAVAGIGLDGTKVIDADLEKLKGLTRLKRLSLRDTAITDEGLAHLGGLRELQELDLSHTKITDVGLEQLKSLPVLGQLRLTDNPITDSGVAHLKDCANLVLLSLAGTEVSDAGVAELKNLTRMASLHLENTVVTDASLENLKGFTQLESLGLNGTKVTDAGVAEIKAALPNCDVQK